MRKNKVLCIIPARGGSKGINLKICKIDGKPLILRYKCSTKKQGNRRHIRFNR